MPVEQTLVLAPLPVARGDVEGEAADRPRARLGALLLLLEVEFTIFDIYDIYCTDSKSVLLTIFYQ